MKRIYLKKLLPLFFGMSLVLPQAQCDDVADAAEEAAQTLAEIVDFWTNQYEAVTVSGAQCGDGSQYRIFVNENPSSDNVVFIFEPGGACWDYETCSGNAPAYLTPANLDGVPSNHMTLGGTFEDPDGIVVFHSPFLWNNPTDTTPTADWTKVFIPYCTGDGHTGSNENVVYEDPDSSASITFNHVGHDNVKKAIQTLQDRWDNEKKEKMLVTGCSAGGTGAQVNYHVLREGLLESSGKGYLLNDSGPIYPSAGNSNGFHDTIYDGWGLRNNIIVDLQTDLSIDMDIDASGDFGNLVTGLAATYPNDRFAHTQFTRDYDFSRFSYERHYDPSTDADSKSEIHALWLADQATLKTQFDAVDNMYYHIPYFRDFNNSHCTTLLSFQDSDAGGQNVADFIDDLVDTGTTPTNAYEDTGSESGGGGFGWDLINELIK